MSFGHPKKTYASQGRQFYLGFFIAKNAGPDIAGV